MMNAAWIEEFGGTEVIRVGERAKPDRPANNVLVRMVAATLNHHDIYLRRGEAGRVPLPVILGSDGVGTVVESDGAEFEAGENVAIYPVLSCSACAACRAGSPHKCVSFGMIGGERDGTHAEFVAVPKECLVRLPAGLSAEAAAGLSVAGLTAWNMVHDEGAARAGEHALVLGASGGVGTLIVRLLKRLGVTVHAVTSSPAKREFLFELGADTVLPDDAASVLTCTRQLPERGVDIAFNCVGGRTWRYVLGAVRTGGRVMVCGTVRAPSAELDMRQVFYRSLSIIGCSMGRPDALRQLLELAAFDDRFQSPIHETIRLSALRDAHHKMETAQLRGKILIQIQSDGADSPTPAASLHKELHVTESD
jgi:NADPH:quinone reductase-like Zn-dependent oxidoreductase